MAQTYTYTLSLNDKISSVMKNITGSSDVVNAKLKGLSETQKKLQGINGELGGSMYELKQKVDLLQQEKEFINPSNIKDVKVYNSEIDKLIGKIDEIDQAGRKERKNPFAFVNVSATIQQVQAVSDAIANMSVPGIGFNQSMADLSSITGIVGDELKELGEVARKTGAESGMGAAQGAKAFEYLASQIDVSKIGLDGLKELQTKTITLAQASGMTMADSALALSGTINQFGLSADQASRVINVLAAGSKYGAAEISDLSQSFKVVGAAANAAGLSVEGTAGAIEVLSKNNLKGAEAGTALRNIILKMQTELGVDFSKTSLGDALESLKPKLKDATYLSKLFGMENIAAAQFMIGNTDAIKEMTERVTDTNVAQEQAAIRTDTWQNRMDVARATVDNWKIGLFELTDGWIAYGAIVAENIVTVSQLIPLYNALNSGVKNLFAIDAVTGKMKILTAATWKQNFAFLASPITWVIVGIAALVAGIVLLWNKCEGFRKVVLGVWEVLKLFGSLIKDVIVDSIKNFIGGIGSLGSAIAKLFKGDFKGAAQEAKDGVEKLFKSSPIGVAMNVTAKVSNADIKGAWNNGTKKGVKGKVETTENGLQTIVKTPEQSTPVMPQISEPLKIAEATTGVVSATEKLNLNNIKGSTNYGAITAQLAPVVIDSMPRLASPSPLPNNAQTDNSMQMQGSAQEQSTESRKTRFDQFCDSLTINIASANDKGYEQIKDEIIDELQMALA